MESDFGREFDLILAVKVVKNMESPGAYRHVWIPTYRAIVTKDYARNAIPCVVDAGAVLVNASTRLNDGYQFGLGAEIGISTSACMREARWDWKS